MIKQTTSFRIILLLMAGILAISLTLTSCDVPLSSTDGEAYSATITELSKKQETSFSSSKWANPKVRVIQVDVTKVSDGDTIRATVDGKNQRVRLIGVNSPEIAHPDAGIEEEYYGKEAFAYTKDMLEGKKVFLSFDGEEKDKYGRLLAYLWLDDPRGFEEDFDYAKQYQFNCILIENGYAKSVKIPPNLTFYSLQKSLSREAKEAKRGLWGAE